MPGLWRDGACKRLIVTVLDALLRERGGISSLQPGDDTDPDGDRVILAQFQRLGLVPNGADGNSREHWGHTDEDLHPDGPTEYGLLTHEQYETANRRYFLYHERKIRRLREQIAGPPPSTPPPRGPRVSEPPGTSLRGQGAPPSHLTGGGPWSLHSLAALEVDKQMQTLRCGGWRGNCRRGSGGGIIGKRVRYECTASLSVICHSTT